MPELTKAILQPITANENPHPTGDPIILQFNPSSLRLRYVNEAEGGETRGRQTRQFIGRSSTTLSLELIFDTADEGTTEQPRSVREKVMPLQQLVLPSSENNETPPKVRFHWSEIVVDGIVTSLDVEYELFAHNGVPLRAKASFTISEQDNRYHFFASGPGARGAAAARLPGMRVGAPGGPPAPPGDRLATALAGETAPDFAARMGLDPQAWRGLGVDLGAGTSLQAGVEVRFGASLEAGLTLGTAVGFEAGAAASVTGRLETALGLSNGDAPQLTASAAAGAMVSGRSAAAAGFILAGAGGVASALETVKAARAEAAATSARTAFAAPQPVDAAGGKRATGVSIRNDAGAMLARPTPPRAPLMRAAVSEPAAGVTAPEVPLPTTADARTVTYGLGVPLKPRRGTAASSRSDVVPPFLVLSRASATAAGGEPPTTRDRTLAPWVVLPAVDAGRDRAVAVSRRADSDCRCAGARR